MERFREWVCETQVENSNAVSRLSRNSALKRRISDVSPVSVMCQYTEVVAGIFRLEDARFLREEHRVLRVCLYALAELERRGI